MPAPRVEHGPDVRVLDLGAPDQGVDVGKDGPLVPPGEEIDPRRDQEDGAPLSGLRPASEQVHRRHVGAGGGPRRSHGRAQGAPGRLVVRREVLGQRRHAEAEVPHGDVGRRRQRHDELPEVVPVVGGAAGDRVVDEDRQVQVVVLGPAGDRLALVPEEELDVVPSRCAGAPSPLTVVTVKVTGRGASVGACAQLEPAHASESAPRNGYALAMPRRTLISFPPVERSLSRRSSPRKPPAPRASLGPPG